MRILLVSTYELGHQPLHVASPAAKLRQAGHEVRCRDLAVEQWEPEDVAWADKVAFSVPMHTAMRLAMQAAQAVKRDHPDKPVCLYGLYAPVSRDLTLGRLADRVIAGEYEPALVAWAGGATTGPELDLGRGTFAKPARDLLPPLDRYARLVHEGEERLVGYVEASHGCVHVCRHCPVPTVYDGRIRIVQQDTVLADISQLVDMGARHITFGDPDFLNGRKHSLAVVNEMHERFPHLTFDCTVKVEHILEFPQVWPDFARAGCLFVVSAFESVNDEILTRLKKDHTAAQAADAIVLLREHGIEIRPSFMPFTPWTTTADVSELLDFVGAHDLVGNVDPVQYTIRLLLPEGSLLLDHPDIAPHLGPYDAERLSWTWTSADPAVDEMQARLAALAEAAAADGEAPARTYERICAEVGSDVRIGAVEERPRLTEPWFCCAEPTESQFGFARSP